MFCGIFEDIAVQNISSLQAMLVTICGLFLDIAIQDISSIQVMLAMIGVEFHLSRKQSLHPWQSKCDHRR